MKNLSLLACMASAIVGVVAGWHFKPKSPSVIVNNEVKENTLSEWQLMQLAIMKTESEFDPLAVGKSEDWGILQITPIYVKEVNRILGEDRFSHEDAFNVEKSMEMFEITQNYHNPAHDVDRAIASHNPTATSAYLVKVRRNMDCIKKYEQLRMLVIEK